MGDERVNTLPSGPSFRGHADEHAVNGAGVSSACRHCGQPMGWPRPVGIVLADGTAAHHACAEWAEVERIRRRGENALSPDALADEAEVTVRGELA
jgi:hypothetical protein